MHARCLEACPSTYVHNSPAELKVRAEMTCRGCDAPKEHSGLIVCWRCFSHRRDGKNFKYFNSLVTSDRWAFVHPTRGGSSWVIVRVSRTWSPYWTTIWRAW